MKTLSLWQPWATLIAIGAKQYETRSWGTSYRGPLVIHAAKSEQGLRDFAAEVFSVRQMGQSLERFPLVKFLPGVLSPHMPLKDHSLRNLPRGAAICVVDVVDCIRMTDDFIASMTEQEQAFGLWQPGRYAWHLSNPRRFYAPIPMRGSQGLFESAPPLKDLVYE